MKNFGKKIKDIILYITVFALTTPVILGGISCSKVSKKESESVINDVVKSISVKYKGKINQNEVLASQITKSNFYQYFDLQYDVQSNQNIKIDIEEIKEDEKDCKCLKIKFKVTYKDEISYKEIQIAGFKENLLELKKLVFNVLDFGINVDSIKPSDFKININNQWIFENKSILFNNFEGNLNINDINNLKIDELDSAYLKISFKIGNKTIDFWIDGFKVTNVDSNQEISLIKNNFEPIDLGFKLDIFIGQINEKITEQWIFENKLFLFKNASLIKNQNDISSLSKEEDLDQKTLNVSCKIKDKVFKFKIINLLWIKLNKTVFQANELELSSKTIQETKQLINNDWILNKKDILFVSNNFDINSSEILNLKLESNSNTKLTVSFTLKNTEFKFFIEGLKESTGPFVEPTTLEELRESNPDDIAKLKKYDSSKYDIVVNPEWQYRNVCWLFGVAGTSETSILKEGINGYTKNGNKILNINEYDLEKHIIWRDFDKDSIENPFVIDELGNSNWDYYSGDLNEGNWTEPAIVPLTQRAYYNNGIHLESYSVINKIEENNSGNLDVEAIKKEIAKYGAVTASYDSKGGKGWKIENLNTGNNTIPDHCISIVGWDDTIKSNQFQNHSGYSNPASRDGAWIVKNSWGSTGGRGDGYFYLSYDSTINGVVSLDWNSWNENENFLYYYDGSGKRVEVVQEWQFRKKAATIFKALNASDNIEESIEKVSFGLRDGNNVKVKAEIFLDVDSDLNPYTLEDNPTSGKLVATKEETYEYPGIKTLELDKPIKIEPGQKFSIVITIVDNGDGNDPFLTLTLEEKSYNDMSFVYDLNNNRWVNSLYGNDKILNCVARIRAITSTRRKSTNKDNNISFAQLSLREEDYKKLKRYKNNEEQPKPVVKLNNEILKLDQDYKISYGDVKVFKPTPGYDISATAYGTIHIIGIGKYEGKNEINYPLLVGLIPSLDIFETEEYGWKIIKDPNDYKSTSIEIPKSKLNNKTMWSDIKLPNNFKWAFESYELSNPTEQYLVYNGKDSFAFRKEMFKVKIV